MIFLVGIVLFLLCGYCLLLLTNMAIRHLLHDLALGWFFGAAYYSLASCALFYIGGVDINRLTSLAIIMIPCLVVLFRIGSYSPFIIRSARDIRNTEYLPGNKFISFESVLLYFAVFMYLLVFLHGASTPINTDDALFVRAYSPIMVYQNLPVGGQVFHNGIWPSFVTVFFWHMAGGIEPFYVNYTVLTSLSFFLALVYLAPTVRGFNKYGIYNVFLVMSLPLFVFHGTTAYSDIRMAMPYALGFLFFTLFVRNGETKDFVTAILFFVITGLVKSKGVVAGVTGITVVSLYLVYLAKMRGRLQYRYLAIIAFSPLMLLPLYILNKELFSSHISSMFEMLIQAPKEFFISTFYNLGGAILDATTSGQNINWGQTAFRVKFSAFFHSLFTSANFGILFYVLIANMVLNLKNILTTRRIWEFIFFFAVILEAYYYLVIRYQNLDRHEDVLQRAIMVVAVLGSIYLASLLTKYGTAESCTDERLKVS